MIVYFSVILSYAIFIYWNAKNSNNSLNINSYGAFTSELQAYAFSFLAKMASSYHLWKEDE